MHENLKELAVVVAGVRQPVAVGMDREIEASALATVVVKELLKA